MADDAPRGGRRDADDGDRRPDARGPGEPEVLGGIVQRATLHAADDDGAPRTLTLRMRRPGATEFLVVKGTPRGLRVGFLDLPTHRRCDLGAASDPRVGPAARAFFRVSLEGARLVRLGDGVTGVGTDGVADRSADRSADRVADGGAGREGMDGLVLARGDVRVTIATSPAGALVVRTARDADAEAEVTSGDAAGDTAGNAASDAAVPLVHVPEAAMRELRARGEALAAEIVRASFDVRKRQLARALGKARAKLERRAAAVTSDHDKALAAIGVATHAAAFVAEAARAKPGATSLVIVDWTSGAAEEARLPLDPARPARAQLDALFKRAKRLKQSLPKIAARRAEADALFASLAPLAARAAAATTAEELEAVERDAGRAAPRDFAAPGRATAAKDAPAFRAKDARGEPARARRPYRAFEGARGARILVGRGAADNDALTLHVARPHDLFVHAKGRTGAHVIVPLDRKQTCPGDVLVEAAHLAAHFSDARGETTVDVQYAPRRFVRKPKGSAPGAVMVDREKVLVLRKDDGLLAALLGREEPA